MKVTCTSNHMTIKHKSYWLFTTGGKESNRLSRPLDLFFSRPRGPPVISEICALESHRNLICSTFIVYFKYSSFATS